MRVKVCGLTNYQDAWLAYQLGAWGLGFIFYDGSPRNVTAKQVRAIIDEMPSSGDRLRFFGVFVNQAIDEVIEAVTLSQVDTVQLHGDENPDYCNELRTKLPKIRIVKAFRLKVKAEVEQLSDYKNLDAILIDAFSETGYGGTGQTSDWELAVAAKRWGPLILAGGINQDNVAEAIKAVAPYALDVSSHLELKPGVKSPEKMRSFFQALRRQK